MRGVQLERPSLETLDAAVVARGRHKGDVGRDAFFRKNLKGPEAVGPNREAGYAKAGYCLPSDVLKLPARYYDLFTKIGGDRSKTSL